MNQFSMPKAIALCLVAAILSFSSPAFASKSKVKKLARKTKIPLKLLESYKTRRFFSKDVYQRREFIKAITDKPDARMLPLVTLIGTKETADEPIRRCSIRLYSHIGLLADRNDIKKYVFPAVKTALGYGAKRGQDQRWAFEELIRLSKWFELDADLFELLRPVFEGDDFNLRSCAFQALCFTRHEKIGQDYLVPACLRIYHAKKGFSLFDRQRAVRQLQRRGIAKIAPLLRDDMARGKIPKLQILSMDVFAQWKDKSALPVVKKIDYTAVHQLRQGAFRAMAAMKDPSCLEHLINRFGSDHIKMLTSSVEDLHLIGGDKVVKLLTSIYTNKYYPPARVTLWQRKSKPETINEEKRKLKIASAMALLKLNKSLPVAWLESVVRGDRKEFDEAARNKLCGRILKIRTEVTSQLIVAMLKLRGDKFKSTIKATAIAAGERKLERCEKDLLALYKDEKYKGHIQFHAAVSLFELDSKASFKRLIEFMKTYDDNITKNDKTKFVLGKLQFDVKRWEGSEYITALNKFLRTKDPRMLPLILEMLKPIPEDTKKSGKKAKKPAKKKKKPSTSTGTRVRRPKKAKIWLPKGPEPKYRVRNQFVRAKAVLTAARIGGDLSEPVLSQAIVDHRAIVRSNAVRACGELSKRFKLPVGATDQEEANVRFDAETWLAETHEKIADTLKKMAEDAKKKAEKEKADAEKAKKDAGKKDDSGDAKKSGKKEADGGKKETPKAQPKPPQTP